MDVANAIEILGYATYLKNENDTLKAELAKYKRALELACQFSADPEQTMKTWLQQAEKEGE